MPLDPLSESFKQKEYPSLSLCSQNDICAYICESQASTFFGCRDVRLNTMSARRKHKAYVTNAGINPLNFQEHRTLYIFYLFTAFGFHVLNVIFRISVKCGRASSNHIHIH